MNIDRRLRLDAIVVRGRKRACKVVETYRKTGEKLDGLRVVFVKETITGLTRWAETLDPEDSCLGFMGISREYGYVAISSRSDHVMKEGMMSTD